MLTVTLFPCNNLIPVSSISEYCLRICTLVIQHCNNFIHHLITTLHHLCISLSDYNLIALFVYEILEINYSNQSHHKIVEII